MIKNNTQNIQRVTKNIEDTIRASIDKLGQDAVDVARRLCPSESGALKASIYSGSQSIDATSSSHTKGSSIGHFKTIQNIVARRDAAVAAGHKFQSSLANIEDNKSRLNTGSGTAHGPHLDTSQLSVSDAGKDMITVNIGASIFYAGYVEYGHQSHKGSVPARPFIRPAVEWAGKQLPKVITSAMTRGLIK